MRFNSLYLGFLFFMPACSDPAPPSPDGGQNQTPAWQVVLDENDVDGTLLSVWGSGPKDVWAVGGPLGNTGFTTLVMHFDGSAWHRLSPGGEQTFWWVSGSSPDDVWMVGEQGRIAHWDGQTQKFTEHTSGVSATLWGVMAFSPTDVWAVGGTPEGGVGPGNDIVLHWDGSAWSPVVLPGNPLGRSLYKIWGDSPDNLYVVGEYGTIWHKSGTNWVLESDPPLAQGTLFTVYGCNSNEVYAVGGKDILRSNGTVWEKLPVMVYNGANGVSCGRPGEVAVVGFGGLKMRLVNGEWVDDFLEVPNGDMHAVWADGQGSFWAAGGDFISKAAPGVQRKGFIGRFGSGLVSDSVSP